MEYSNDIRAQKVQEMLSVQFLSKYPEIIEFNVYFFLSNTRGGYNVDIFMGIDYYDFHEYNNDRAREHRFIKKDVSNFLKYILGEKEFINTITFNPIKSEEL